MGKEFLSGMMKEVLQIDSGDSFASSVNIINGYRLYIKTVKIIIVNICLPQQ